MNYKLIFALIILPSFIHTQSIFRATCRGDIHILDSLLQTQNIDTTDWRGRSLLHWAIGCNNDEVFQHLISKGINTDIEDQNQKTPMIAAVQLGKNEIFKQLVALQTDSKWVKEYGSSLLESSVLNKDTSLLRFFIEKGINLDTVNQRGSSAIEIAKRINAANVYDKLIELGADSSNYRIIQMTGTYMGQNDPGSIAQIFAPNFISTEESEYGSVFNKAGNEFYFGVDINGRSEIRYSKLIDNNWTKPTTIISHERYGYNDPFLSNDEQRLYYISQRALNGKDDPKDVDIWYSERMNFGWSEPINVGLNINSSSNEYYISFTNDGTMYFSSNVKNNDGNYDIYTSKYVDGEFKPAQVLGSAINTEEYEADVFIAPDESYIIFCSTREDSYGRGDLYISFKDENDNWTPSINMGPEINTNSYEYCPFVSKDGKYLFYTSNQDIYWIDTTIIDKIKFKVLSK